MVNTNENKVSAGRVLIMPRGEWNENITYEMLDLVNHKGYAYLAKRTVVGIEPSDDHPEYWHNMLEIDKIVKEAISGTLADDVADKLEERFRDMLSEARYVEDLLAEFDAPTFVHWNAETINTPYTAELTTSTEGYALVYGHSISAWANGETFTYGANGWDKPINASGGTMSGPLGLGGGVGTVSADEDGAFLEAVQDAENHRRIRVEKPSENVALEDAVNVVSKEDGKENTYSLFGEHNVSKLESLGFAKIQSKVIIGTGTHNNDNPLRLTFNFVPKALYFQDEGRGTSCYVVGAPNICVVSHVSDTGSQWARVNVEDKTITVFEVNGEDYVPFDSKDRTYYCVAIG